MRHRRAGYTMIELMTSIAIAVMLALGVDRVFQIAGDTVGAGSAYAEATRANLSAQAVFYEDVQGAVTSFDAPFFLIRSETVPAFRNAADEQSDRDYDRSARARDLASLRVRTIDLNADGVEGESDVPGEVVAPAAMHPRNHRVDQLCFFARGAFPRQTGNDGTYAADMRGDEAMIWYGHLKQPDASGDLAGAKFPGLKPESRNDPAENVTTNPNNFYATDWALGRVAILLREPTGTGASAAVYDNHGTPQVFIRQPTNPSPRSLAPLGQHSKASASTAPAVPQGNATAFEIQWSRFDLAGTSIAGYRRILSDAIGNGRNDWYEPRAGAGGNGSTGFGYRFSGYPYPSRPLTSAGYARTVPIFLPHCTQFVVEFAGDFLTQDADGTVHPVVAGADGYAVPAPDGVVDFFAHVVDGVPHRSIRWYGFPRDVNGDGVIQGNRANNEMPDVVPLRDVAGGVPFKIERDVNDGQIGVPSVADYFAPAGVPRDGRYLCAWGPDTVDCPTPRMIRLTLALDDPRGRLPPEGRTFEYVLSLP